MVTGCRIEDRTPTGSRRDEDTIQHLLSRYARRLSQRNWTGVRELFWQDGSYAGPIGPGAPPIKTDQGWLSIYHGVFRTMDGSVYRLGVALHDLLNPAKIIGVGDS